MDMTYSREVSRLNIEVIFHQKHVIKQKETQALYLSYFPEVFICSNQLCGQ